MLQQDFRPSICLREFFTNLQNFDVDGQFIVEVKKEIFEACSNVTAVCFRLNRNVDSLESDLLLELENLVIFQFEDTNVQYLHEDFFKNNLKLQNIYLNHNSLKVINVDFSPLKSIKTLSMFGNPCIGVGFDANNPRSPSLANVTAEIKEHCNNITNPNVLSTTPPPVETSNELRLANIESALEAAEDGSKAVADMLEQESEKLEKLFNEVKKNFDEKFKDSTSLQPIIKNVTNDYKKISEIQEKFKESLKNSELNFAEIKAQLDTIKELEKKNENFRESIDQSENLMLAIYTVQLVTIAFAVYITVYFKFN